MQIGKEWAVKDPKKEAAIYNKHIRKSAPPAIEVLFKETCPWLTSRVRIVTKRNCLRTLRKGGTSGLSSNTAPTSTSKTAPIEITTLLATTKVALLLWFLNLTTLAGKGMP